jgi:uncharacterized protein (TIGR02453 family)
MSEISKENLDFLNLLKKNNNRDWFAENKVSYLKNHENIIQFSDSLLALLSQHDTIETPSGKKSLYRIYRDIRFSKNKSPYKTNWAGGFRRATKNLRGSYYFHIEKDYSMVGGGFWSPNKEDLKRIRDHIALDASPFREIINAPAFIATFGNLQGEQLKTAPKGFDKNHPDIDLLRYKQFIVSKKFTDKEVLSPNFNKKVNETFQIMRPFFDFMSEILTTDLNGESIV